MKIIAGLLGSIIGVFAIAVIPAPKLKITSYVTSYNYWTGEPNVAWKGWVYIFAIVVGFLIAELVYSRRNSE